MRDKIDWSVTKVGDKLSKDASFRRPGTPVFVVKRTPKQVYLDDGVKLHVGGLCRDYEPWSDEREAKRRQERDAHEAWDRFRRLDVSIYSVVSAGSKHRLTADDAVRDPAMLDELEAMLRRHEAERHGFVMRIIAGRPAEAVPSECEP